MIVVDQAGGKNMSPNKFLRFQDVQARLCVSRTTLWRWCVERGLKVVRVGNVARIRESDFDAFLARHEAAVSGKEADPQQPADAALVT
jgi:excisionase family DNA binding protein